MVLLLLLKSLTGENRLSDTACGCLPTHHVLNELLTRDLGEVALIERLHFLLAGRSSSTHFDTSAFREGLPTEDLAPLAAVVFTNVLRVLSELKTNGWVTLRKNVHQVGRSFVEAGVLLRALLHTDFLQLLKLELAAKDTLGKLAALTCLNDTANEVKADSTLKCWHLTTVSMVRHKFLKERNEFVFERQLIFMLAHQVDVLD